MLVYKYFIQLLWKNPNCGKITDEQLFFMLTNVVKINIMELTSFNKREITMEEVENKVNEFIGDIRFAIIDHPRKKTLERKIDYLEDVFNSIINYIYAEQDNLNDLNQTLKGEE